MTGNDERRPGMGGALDVVIDIDNDTRSGDAMTREQAAQAYNELAEAFGLSEWRSAHLRGDPRHHALCGRESHPEGFTSVECLKMRRWLLARLVERFEAMEDGGEWRGRGSDSDHAVYRAYLGLALEARTLVVSMSVRKVAEVAGVSRGTVENARVRLVERGLLGWTPRKAGTDSKTVRLVVPEWSGFANLDSRDPRSGSSSSSGTDTSTVQRCESSRHDAFRLLGGKAERLYEAVNGERDIKALAQVAGCHLATAYRKVKYMVADGLIVKDESGTYSRTGKSLDEYADELGATGRAEQQRARHQAERAAYAEYQHRRDEREAAAFEAALAQKPDEHTIYHDPRPEKYRELEALFAALDRQHRQDESRRQREHNRKHPAPWDAPERI